MRLTRALGALAALLALASAGAGGVRAADDTSLGAAVTSHVYIDQGGRLLVLSRSTVPVVVILEPSDGWSVEPASLALDPGEEAAAVLSGEGAEGAEVVVRVAPAAEPPPGEAPAEVQLVARVFYEAPFDLGRAIAAVLPWAALVILAGLALWRIRPWELRIQRGR